MPCAAAQVIKLPAGKYTVREREMLSGVAGAPESYFMPGNAFSNGLIFCEHPLLLCSSTPLSAPCPGGAYETAAAPCKSPKMSIHAVMSHLQCHICKVALL